MGIPSRETTAAVERTWAERWPGTGFGALGMHGMPGVEELGLHRGQVPHHRAEFAVEYAEAALRQASLVEFLQARDSDVESLIVVTRSWSFAPKPVAGDERDSWLRRFVEASYWRTTEWDPGDPDDPEDSPAVYQHLWLSEVAAGAPELTSLAILAANDQSDYAMFFPPSMRWVFRQCDEGSDLWTRDAPLAAALRAEFADWLGKPEYTPVPQPDEPTDWVVAVPNLTERQARELRSAVEGAAILPPAAKARIRDPGHTLDAELSRDEVQLLLAALSDHPREVFSSYDQTLETLTPAAARDGLQELGFLETLDAFDRDGYRYPGEAVDGCLPRRHWNPALDYSGIDGSDDVD